MADAFVGTPTGEGGRGLTPEERAAAERGETALDFIRGADWEKTGGNNSTGVYTNRTTGEIVYYTPSSGRIDRFENQAAVDAADKAQSGSATGITPSGFHQAISGDSGEIKDDLDTLNPVGHPGFSDDQELGFDANGNPTGGPGHIADQLTGALGGGTPFAVGGDVSGNIQAAIDRQAAIADAAGAERAAYQPLAAPTVAGPGQIYAEFAQQQAPIQAQIAQAQQAQAANVGQTVITPQQQAIQAQQIAAAQVGPLQQAQIAQAGPTTIGPTSLANAAQLSLAQQQQLRDAQLGLVTGLQGAIAGKEPSVAEIMLRQATDRNVANQYALAQAANGMNTGLAQRQAMINAAELNQNAIGQQALLRAQELQANRGQLAALTGQARGADIDVAANQAALQQQANLQNAGALNTSTLTQAQLSQAQALANAQLAQSGGQFNAGQYNQGLTENAQLQQQAAIANQGAGLQAGTTNAQLAQAVALANAGAQNTTNQTNAQLQQGANLQNAQLGTQASLANANNVTGANTASAQLANAVNLANANNQSQANITGAQLGTQANIASANNQVSTNALNQKATQDLAQNQLTAAGQAGTTSIGQGDVAAKMAEAEAKRQAAMIAGISAAGAALVSDPREKTDLRKAEAEIASWTSTLTPSSFRYKDPDQVGAAPGQRFGIVTSDLKKSKVGRSLVRTRPDGTEEVDVGQAVGAILATLSAMNKRAEAH